MELDNKLKDRILDSIGEGVLTVNKNFKISFFNKAAEHITGYNKEEVIGQFCKYILNSGSCNSNCPISKVLETKENIFDFDYKIKSKSGNDIPLKINASILLDENDEPTGGIFSFRDNTELASLQKNLSRETSFEGIIGQSKQMQNVFNLIKELAESDAPVLITGESGTGKELVANAIRNRSKRKDKEFIKVNCSVFPQNLLASELFGHVKGSFTDAVKDRPGRFELADKGTIFLDEVAEMPHRTQIQLLRVLQEGTFERIGESITRRADVRIIAATNVDIDIALQEKKFRDDLFYRLNVIPIHLAPLRERKEDIYPLVKHFLDKFSVIYNKQISDIEGNAVDILMGYDWQGNVRELENVIEYAFVKTSAGKPIKSVNLPLNLLKNSKSTNFYFGSYIPPRKDNPKDKLVEILEKHKWNKSAAAKELGIGRTTLWRKMKKAGLIE